MGRKAKYDWPHLFETFQGIVASKPDYTLKQFCQENRISYDSARPVFRRLKKKQQGIPESQKKSKKKQKNTAPKRKKTPGVKKKAPGVKKNIDPTRKAAASIAANMDAAQLHAEFIINLMTCRQWSMAVGEKVDSLMEADTLKAYDLNSIMSAMKNLVHIQTSTQPLLIAAFQEQQRQTIIKKLQDGDIDERGAAIQFELLGLPMPKFVHTILARTPVAEPVPTDDGFDVKELDDIWAEYLDESETEKVWLEKRREDVKVIRLDVEKQKTGKTIEAEKDKAEGGAES